MMSNVEVITKVELKNIHHSERNSQETFCFDAAIYINGKKAGTVENDGNGGSCSYFPFDLEVRLNKYAESLPKIKISIGLGNDVDFPESEFSPDAESIVFGLVSDYLVRKDFKAMLSKKLIITKLTSHDIFSAKLSGGVKVSEYLKKLIGDSPAATSLRESLFAKFNAQHILNLLPFDEAFKIYQDKLSLHAKFKNRPVIPESQPDAAFSF